MSEQPTRGGDEPVPAGGVVPLPGHSVPELEERIRGLTEDLRATRVELHRVSRELTLLQMRRSVRAALKASDALRPVVQWGRRGKQAARSVGAALRPSRIATQERVRLRASAAEEQALRKRFAEVLVPAPLTSGPLVSVVVLTRDGIDHLRRLMPALESQAYRDIELVVVDNASDDGTLAWLRGLQTRLPVKVVANEINRSFSQANNQGAEAATGELLLLLNNDTEPAGPHVVGHMVARILADETVVAVGSRLVYPKRKGPRRGPVSATRDLTLQHRGIAFATESGTFRARNIGNGEDPLGEAASSPAEVEAATAACLMVRRTAYEAIGGFALGYDYGQEDVDLCLRLRASGGRIVYEPQATVWHNESATQKAEDGSIRAQRQLANRRLLADRWAPRISRQVLLDRLAGELRWASTPLHVGITLTKDDPKAGWGDYYTAHELGDALAGLGYRVSYLERHADHWYEPDPSVDVVVCLLDAIDIRRLPDGVITVAWIRNWTDRWLGHEWFDEYDIVLASSHKSKEMVDANSVHVAELMPLASNPARFTSPYPRPEPVADVVFTANRWGQPRGVEAVVPMLAKAGHKVAVHGKGWENVPEMAPYAKGELAYDSLPAAYQGARLLIDDTAGPTLPYGAMNSRVFDALASGTLVITDNVVGADELFEGRLPCASDPDAIAALANRLLADPAGSRALADELQAMVLGRHTYAHRARELRDILRTWVERPRVDVAVPVPGWEKARTWGDYHFGRALQRALQRQGVRSRVRMMGAWETPQSATADVVIGIVGIQVPRKRPGQVSALWIISHPDLATAEALAPHDIVFVASDQFAAELTSRMGRQAIPLHQATDPDRFRPTPGGPVHELLFIANSRLVRRRVTDALAGTRRDLAVYGGQWIPELLDPRFLRGSHVPNEQVPAFYTAASVVLNDHWADMADDGFLSNRLYDAAACGAFVVSDEVPGLEAEFDGGIVTFRDAVDLEPLLERYLADPATRSALAARARAAVLARHTFAHRAASLLDVVRPRLAERPDRIVS